MKTLTITLTSTRVGCPPISCGNGAMVAFELADASVYKGRDGSGWLVGTIAADPVPICPIGVSDWVYVINFPDSEFSDTFLAEDPSDVVPADMKTGTGSIGMCCLHCGDIMLLDKQAAVSAANFTRESFRLYNDNEVIAVGDTRLFRMHSPLLIPSFEISCEEHLSGYPYPATPGEIEVTLLVSPPHLQAPLSVASTTTAIIDPASIIPLTGRAAIVPNLEIAAGAAVWARIDCEDPENHLGLEVHVDLVVQPE